MLVQRYKYCKVMVTYLLVNMSTETSCMMRQCVYVHVWMCVCVCACVCDIKRKREIHKYKTAYSY